MGPLDYILSALLGSALIWGGLGHYEADTWEDKYHDLHIKFINESNNYKLCTETLTATNDMIIADSIDYEKRLKERKIVTVEKIIPKYITLEKGDCNETSIVLDFIRTNHP